MLGGAARRRRLAGAPPRAVWRMRTILVVDDSPVVRHAVARRLAAEGFDVRQESTVASARDADPGTLVCAILDLELGDGDGSDLAAALLGKRASLPIAFFTADASPSLLERARSQGPVFHKPDVEAVVAWAKRAIQPPPTK
jgi:CheY-like chemotaxis protein